MKQTLALSVLCIHDSICVPLQFYGNLISGGAIGKAEFENLSYLATADLSKYLTVCHTVFST